MKKGSFLAGRSLGAANEPTADAIREMNRALTEAPTPPTTVAPPISVAAVEKTAAEPTAPTKERTVRITVDLPESLHEALKFYTFRRKTTIKDLFVAHVEQLVAGEK